MNNTKQYLKNLYVSIMHEDIHTLNYERLLIHVKNPFIINGKHYVETIAKGFYNLRQNSVYLSVEPPYKDNYCDREISELIENREIHLVFNDDELFPDIQPFPCPANEFNDCLPNPHFPIASRINKTVEDLTHHANEVYNKTEKLD